MVGHACAVSERNAAGLTIANPSGSLDAESENPTLTAPPLALTIGDSDVTPVPALPVGEALLLWALLLGALLLGVLLWRGAGAKRERRALIWRRSGRHAKQGGGSAPAGRGGGAVILCRSTAQTLAGLVGRRVEQGNVCSRSAGLSCPGCQSASRLASPLFVLPAFSA